MACKLPDTLTALPVGLRENTIIDAYFAGKGTSGPKPDIEGMGLSVNDDRYLNFTIKTMQDQMSALASCLTDTLMVNARSWLFLEVLLNQCRAHDSCLVTSLHRVVSLVLADTLKTTEL